MSAKVTVRDRGWNRIKQNMLALAKKPHVKVGVLDDGAHGDGGLSVAELAAIHEFGAPGAGIPARSFIRSTLDENKAEYAELIRKGLAAVLAGRLSPAMLLEAIGAKVATDIKKRVTSGDGLDPPLAESTVEAKGSERPLVDTGRLIGAVTWKVMSADGE